MKQVNVDCRIFGQRLMCHQLVHMGRFMYCIAGKCSNQLFISYVHTSNFQKYRLFRFKTDWQMAVLWSFPAIFCQLYDHLSQNWDSDGHFEVLKSSKSLFVQELSHRKQIFPFLFFCDFVKKRLICVFYSFAFCVITFAPITF